MNYLRASTLLVSFLALLFAGCGKSQEQKKMEADLNSEVNALKKEVESSLSGFDELRNKLGATLQMHNELQKKYAKKMKNHSADDITTAGRMLETAKEAADVALANLSSYKEQLPHDQAMKALNQNKEALVRAKDRVAEAIQSATAALSNHEQMKNTLTKKTSSKAKLSAKAPKKKAGTAKAR
jgi:hypothetical protein